MQLGCVRGVGLLMALVSIGAFGCESKGGFSSATRERREAKAEGPVSIDDLRGENCKAAQVRCSGGCIDPLSSNGFCGAKESCEGANAGAVCYPGTSCVGGKCVNRR